MSSGCAALNSEAKVSVDASLSTVSVFDIPTAKYLLNPRLNTESFF